MLPRRRFLQVIAASAVLPTRGLGQQQKPADGFHVDPNVSIQDALEAAAKDPAKKIVYVHAGTYRPRAKGQALIWFNARHDGITLQAVGDVTLTAANPSLSDPEAPSRQHLRSARPALRCAVRAAAPSIRARGVPARAAHEIQLEMTQTNIHRLPRRSKRAE